MEKCNEIQLKSIFNGIFIAISILRTRNYALLVFSPPLITSKEEVDESIEIFQDVLSQIS